MLAQKQILNKAVTEAGGLGKLSKLTGLPESRLSEWRNEKHSIGFNKLTKILKAVNLEIKIV